MKNALALGTFDGLHKGHLAVLSMPDGYNKIALTFETPPKAVLSGEPCSIMTFHEKAERMAELGITAEKLKFQDVCSITAENFLQDIKEQFNPQYISCGFNYHFGKGGLGNTQLLKQFCKENDIILNICEPVIEDGEPVSSSRIRNYLKNGETKKANLLLSDKFTFEAKVLHGDSRGRTLGFPTINQRYPKELVPIKFGVYKSDIVVNGKVYNGITNIGNRPTYPVDYIISETFIKDFSGDLYGKKVRIIPIEFLREEKKFNSFEELKEQIEKDIRR